MRKLCIILALLVFLPLHSQATQTTLKVTVDATMDGNAANETGEDWRLTDFENWSKQHGMNSELYHFQGPWVTLKDYTAGEFVNYNSNIYVCVTNHTSGTFATDLAAVRWKFWGSDIYAAVDHNHSGVYEPAKGTDDNFVTDAEKTEIGTIGNLALKSNVLELNNTSAFTPDADYEPATKKYVDDNAGSGTPEVQDEAFSAANFDADTTHAVSQDDFYDRMHLYDADDDGSFTDEAWFPSTSGAPTSASYLTATAEAGLSAESNLGALTTGLLKITVAAGSATPSTAVAGTDYQAPLTNPVVQANLGTGVYTFLGTPTIANFWTALTGEGAFAATLLGYADGPAVRTGIGAEAADATIIKESEIDDSPNDGNTTQPASSNSVYDLSVTVAGKASASDISFNAAALNDLTIQGTTQTAGAFTTGLVYEIVSVGTTDFTAIGASANTVGLTFTASGAGTGTGTAIPYWPTVSDTITPGDSDDDKRVATVERNAELYQPLIDTEPVETTGTIQGKMVFNSYATATTLTAADHNASIVQMTVAGEVTMWDCEAANVGDWVALWARDAEKIEAVPPSGDHFTLFNGTALTADYELDISAMAGTKVTLMCTADDTWSVYSETAASTDGGAAD